MQADGRSTYKENHSYDYCSFLERTPAAALSQPHRHLAAHIISLFMNPWLWGRKSPHLCGIVAAQLSGY